MEIKIAHCADVHLGMKPNNNKLVAIRRAEIKSSFFKMLDIINENDVDLFLIAGDLFHDLNVNDSEVEEVKNALKNLKCKVAISPGNHDPFVLGSPYYSVWPENVYIFKENTINYFEIPQIHTRIWGSAFTPFNSSGAKIPQKYEINEKFINILLIHGTYPPSEGELYNPISTEEIRKSGMNYIALGHIHKGTPVLRDGKTFYAYPGCLEGRSFKETGEKGFYLGTLSDSSCKLEFVKMSKRIYLEINVDITEVENSVEICQLITDTMRKKSKESYINNIYRIVLLGNIGEDFFIDIGYIKNKLEETVFFVEIVDKTDLICKGEGNNIKSIFIKNMTKYIKNCEDNNQREIAKKALKLGIMSFSGEVDFHED